MVSMGVTPADIPAKYKQNKIIGKGATSIITVDPESPNWVYVFTRDDGKYEWYMAHGFKVEYVDEVEYTGRSYWKKEFPLHIIHLEILYKLSTANKRIVKNITECFYQITNNAKNYAKQRGGKNTRPQAFDVYHGWYDHRDDLIAQYNFSEETAELVDNIIDFYSNYDPEQYTLDIHGKQFMQTLDGKLVCVDVMVNNDLLKKVFGR